MSRSVIKTVGPASAGEDGLVEGLRFEERSMVDAVGSWSRGDPMAGAEVDGAASVACASLKLAVGPGPASIGTGALVCSGDVVAAGAVRASEMPATVGGVCDVESCANGAWVCDSWLISTGVDDGRASVCSFMIFDSALPCSAVAASSLDAAAEAIE